MKEKPLWYYDLQVKLAEVRLKQAMRMAIGLAILTAIAGITAIIIVLT